jgi:hypothetical protein
VEFVGITVAGVWHRLYLPAKGCAAALLYPLKLLDGLYRRNRRADRLGAGYYIIGRKFASAVDIPIPADVPMLSASQARCNDS